MKALLFITFAFLLFTFLSSCSDSNPVSSSSQIPCTKSVTLLTPPNDTVFQAHEIDSIYFSWTATCSPSKYQIQLDVNPTGWDSVQGYFLTNNAIWLYFAGWPPLNTWFYWRITAYYGSPVTDSVVSPVFQYKYIIP